jgi:hypothetical protein
MHEENLSKQEDRLRRLMKSVTKDEKKQSRK